MIHYFGAVLIGLGTLGIVLDRGTYPDWVFRVIAMLTLATGVAIMVFSDNG